MLSIQKFTFNPFSENTYVLYDEKGKAALVDPGNFTDEETERLLAFIDSNSLSIEKILLTHAHIDHIFGLEKMLSQTGAPLYMHPNEKEILDHNPVTAQMFGFRMDPIQTDFIPLEAGGEINVGNEPLSLLYVPGHSPGSIAFYSESSALVISGDALFQGSIGRTDLYKGNHQQLIQSIENQLFTLPDHVKVYSGHGEITEIGTEKRTNPFFT